MSPILDTGQTETYGYGRTNGFELKHLIPMYNHRTVQNRDERQSRQSGCHCGKEEPLNIEVNAMIEDWIVVICGVVAIVVVMTVTLLKLRSAERRMHESTYKLKVYTDLLNAITELNLATW